jgi:hypothetical protein
VSELFRAWRSTEKKFSIIGAGGLHGSASRFGFPRENREHYTQTEPEASPDTFVEILDYIWFYATGMLKRFDPLIAL